MERKTKQIRIIFIILFTMTSCVLFSLRPEMKAPEDSSGDRIPLYPESKIINIDQKDIEQVIEDSFGYDYLLYESSTNVSWTEDIGDSVQIKFDEMLPEDKWRIQSDWLYGEQVAVSEWRKGDLELTIAIIDNLNSEDLRDLKMDYGIDGLETGWTLIISHVIDITKPLPNMTATAEIQSLNNTATAEAKTAAVEATQAAQVTAQAIIELEQLLPKYNEDFNSPELADYWEIYNPNQKKWDLTNEPGMLHIMGAPRDGAQIQNLFGVRVTDMDIEVTTRIEVNNMSSMYQRVFIAFSPEENLFNDTVMIGLRYVKNDVIFHSEADSEIYTGYQIYMSAADNFLTSDPIKKVEKIDYDGSVYLKLVRKGMEYEGYYSKDGKEWMLINKYERDYQIITDQIIIGASCGGMWGNDFDAYFDFIHYAIPE